MSYSRHLSSVRGSSNKAVVSTKKSISYSATQSDKIFTKSGTASGNAASGSATIKFAGGSNPTLTTDANHVDILSFYWDADNEICYGVETLDFQF